MSGAGVPETEVAAVKQKSQPATKTTIFVANTTKNKQSATFKLLNVADCYYFRYFQFSTGRRNEITEATTQKIATGVKSY